MKMQTPVGSHLAPVGSHLAACFCSPVSKVTCVAFADTGVVSYLIILKDEKMKEDAAREPPPGTRGVPLGSCFCSLVSKVTCVAFADTGVVSSFIILKDEKMWICLLRHPAAPYQFHTLLRGRQCQPEGSESSFGFPEATNQKPQWARAHLTRHCQGHGTESHVYTAPLLRHSILNLPCSRRVGIQNTHMMSVGTYQKHSCDLVLSRAQMYFQSDCKS